MFVSYLGERGVLCVGNSWHFLYTSRYENVEYKVLGPWVKYFVFNKCAEIIIFTILFVVKRVLVGIMLTQRRRPWPRITSASGQCIVLSGVSGARILKVTSIMQQSEKTVQSPNAVSIEPAMGCNAGLALNRNLVGRPTSSVSGTS